MCLSTLPPDSGTLISKWNAQCTFIWKEDFGALSNSPVLFLLSPGKMLLMMFLVQTWLGSSFPEDVWAWWLLMTPASVHSSWSSPKCLNRLYLTVFSSLRSSLLLVHLFLPNFFLPVNFALNMLWYSTPWTAPPFSNDPLWLTYSLCGGVNDHLLDRIQVSSVLHYCAFKEQEIPRMYTVWMVIYWNSNVNILIFWDTDFWLSLAASSNKQFFLKCFTLHVMNLKYMKVSLFEISYKKFFLLFHHIQICEMYLYVCIYICVCVYIYIYIYALYNFSISVLFSLLPMSTSWFWCVSSSQ